MRNERLTNIPENTRKIRQEKTLNLTVSNCFVLRKIVSYLARFN